MGMVQMLSVHYYVNFSNLGHYIKQADTSYVYCGDNSQALITQITKNHTIT